MVIYSGQEFGKVSPSSDDLQAYLLSIITALGNSKGELEACALKNMYRTFCSRHSEDVGLAAGFGTIDTPSTRGLPQDPGNLDAV